MRMEGKERGHREIGWTLDVKGKTLSRWMRLIMTNQREGFS